MLKYSPMFSIELIRPPFRHAIPFDDAKTISEATRKLDHPAMSIQKDDLLIARDIEDQSIQLFSIALSKHKTELVGKEMVSLENVPCDRHLKAYGEAWNTAYYESSLSDLMWLTNNTTMIQEISPVVNAYLRIFSLRSGVPFKYAQIQTTYLKDRKNTLLYIAKMVEDHHLNEDRMRMLHGYVMMAHTRSDMFKEMSEELSRYNHKSYKDNLVIIGEIVRRALPFKTFMKSVDPQLAQVDF